MNTTQRAFVFSGALALGLLLAGCGEEKKPAAASGRRGAGKVC